MEIRVNLICCRPFGYCSMHLVWRNEAKVHLQTTQHMCFAAVSTGPLASWSWPSAHPHRSRRHTCFAQNACQMISNDFKTPCNNPKTYHKTNGQHIHFCPILVPGTQNHTTKQRPSYSTMFKTMPYIFTSMFKRSDSKEKNSKVLTSLIYIHLV